MDFPPVIKAVQGIVTPDIAQSACELAKQRALGLIQQVMRWNKPVLGELRAVEEAADAAEKTEEEHFPFSRLAAEHMLVEHSVAISKLQQLEQENSAAISKLQSQLHMLEPGSTPAEESATALGGLLEEQTAVISEKRMQVQPNHLDKTEAAQGGPNPEEAQEAAQTAEHKRLAEATVQKREVPSTSTTLHIGLPSKIGKKIQPEVGSSPTDSCSTRSMERSSNKRDNIARSSRVVVIPIHVYVRQCVYNPSIRKQIEKYLY